MGFDFTVIVPLLPSYCGFSFVFGCDVYFLVNSIVFMSTIVQQVVLVQSPLGSLLLPLGPNAHTTLCVPSKSGVSVSPNPVEVL